MRRRHFLDVCAAGLAVVLTGCGTELRRAATPLPSSGGSAVEPAPDTTTAAPAPTEVWSMAEGLPSPLPPIPPARPGPADIFGGSLVPGTSQFALTIADGLHREAADAYVAWTMATGIPITCSPNGQYRDIWNPLAAKLAPVIARQQVQLANHTNTHPNLLTLANKRIASEVQRNEAWIEDTFGVTARPWSRPPFGFHSDRTDAAAAELGFTNILLWTGTLGDATLLTPPVLLGQAQRWLQPGRIVPGHANHPTVAKLYGEMVSLIAMRGLRPVTLDQLYGTSRATG